MFGRYWLMLAVTCTNLAGRAVSRIVEWAGEQFTYINACTRNPKNIENPAVRTDMGMSENRLNPYTQWLMIIIPMKNGYLIGNINPTFSDKPTWID